MLNASQTPRNILHVITDLDDGGAEAILYRLCVHDRQGKHSVVSLMDGGKYAPLLRQAGIDTLSLGMPRGGIRPSGMIGLWSLIRRLNPDLIQTWMYHANLIGGLAARAENVPTCWGIHHDILLPGSKHLTRVVSRICAHLSRWLPHRIIYCSAKSASTHKAMGYSARKAVVVHNGYDTDLFSPNSTARGTMRAEMQLVDDIPLIGMVARYDPQKGHACLLSSLGRLKRAGRMFRVVFAGSGMSPDNEVLRSLLKAEGMDKLVTLLGQRDDIPRIMNALDLHVLSSLTESFPNVLAEAMACGTPCVVTDVGDSALIVGDTGWIVPPNNPEALANALCDAFDTMMLPDRWNDHKHSSRRKIAEQFSIQRMVEGYRAAWRSTIKNPGS
jgi:glycosyltransferase involved in cell wall biosynthesis